MNKKRKFISLILIMSIGILVLYLINTFMFGNIKNVNQINNESEVYSKKDIEKAMITTKRQFEFGFRGCKLTDLWYDDDINLSSASSWASQYNADEAIVLLSNFDVGSSGGDGSLNPNDTYSDWQWILVRNKGDINWKLKTWGY